MEKYIFIIKLLKFVRFTSVTRGLHDLQKTYAAICPGKISGQPQTAKFTWWVNFRSGHIGVTLSG